MKEEVYYEDNLVKITNLRFNFKNEMLPIESIDKIDAKYYANSCMASLVAFLLSFLLFIISDLLALIVTVLLCIWMLRKFSKYMELWVTSGDRELKVFHVNYFKAGYAWKIVKELSKAVHVARTTNAEDKPKQTDSLKLQQKLMELE